jgi:8-amino-7-oxononanoate synthase
MQRFEHELAQELAEITAQGLYRELRRVDSPQSTRIRMDGRELLNFSSNDYLGLAAHPMLKDAAIRSVERFGAGSGASRLVCGSLALHHELDEALAAFKGTEAALSFSSGYAAALGAICALVGSDDVIILDRLVHASIVDAARLSRAKLRVFAHNDLESLDSILAWATRRALATPATAPARPPRILIVTESIFSMDGDQAPLRAIVALKERYGSCLMVDEAHATGLYGPHRRGLAEAEGVASGVDIQMGTIGKSIGAAGGYICGSRALIDLLINRARTFVFSTAPVPAAAGAALAGIGLIQAKEGADRCAALWQRVGELATLAGPGLGTVLHASGAIVPIIIGDEQRAVEIAAALRAMGVYIPAIRYPTVARGTARLRLTLTAAHTSQDLQELMAVLPSAF